MLLELEWLLAELLDELPLELLMLLEELHELELEVLLVLQLDQEELGDDMEDRLELLELWAVQVWSGTLTHRLVALHS